MSLPLGNVNVFFGPNGSGKSTVLDTIWFFQDCAIRGVELASSARSHGIGLRWDGAENGEPIAIGVSTDLVEYRLRFAIAAGRIEPLAGEWLGNRGANAVKIDRAVGSDKADVYNDRISQTVRVTLREPDKLSLGMYLDFNPTDLASSELDWLLHFVRRYHSRSFFLHRLKTDGSKASCETRLWERGDNLWSVLRNLHDRRSVDVRFATICRYMTESFPGFDGVQMEQTGPNTVYAHFSEKARRSEIYASGVSDGHLQQLLLLTALFSEGDRPAVILFDEPEVSLHPWPLAVFAKAVEEAAARWNKQVLIATHSPVLLSQFAVDRILATRMCDGRTQIQRLSDMAEVSDLLEHYAAGSLFMSEVIGGQSPSVTQPSGE